ncbi:hypothetical protein CesoFtcFv8_005564 [Champsocephalus esox]|uniref:Secreted protein n=1 Tax=Champsocephalus esox TaxID=159716 RepID=A0AAN8H9V3_9TELE|nr:hypothetical protein CesoFtcFv8_005564 [Champsocephalus esox]
MPGPRPLQSTQPLVGLLLSAIIRRMLCTCESRGPIPAAPAVTRSGGSSSVLSLLSDSRPGGRGQRKQMEGKEMALRRAVFPQTKACPAAMCAAAHLAAR